MRRVRAVALVYALAYFLAGPALALISDEGRRLLFSRTIFWLPPTLSIAGALLVARLASRHGISTRVKLYAGLAFEVLGSYGIAASEYHDIVAPIMYRMGAGDFGLSWVAVWVMLFTVVVPTQPRLALLTAALSLSAIPVMYALGGNIPLHPVEFFFILIFPYLVVLIMAYVGSRVVYGLGAAVTQGAGDGELSAGRAAGQGRHGRSLAGASTGCSPVRRRSSSSGPRCSARRIRPAREMLLRRFEREAQATALMRSPHTMELYDFGMADDGTFYYVMELLDGFDLDELVERFGPVPPERAVHFLRQICDSLAEAHEAGLIHRDVKPANLYACRYGREVDFIKVLDFGLVKQGRAPEEDADKLTAADMSPGGTPGLHVARAGARRRRGGRPERHLRPRLRRLLAPHRLAGVQGNDADGDDRAAREPGARAPLPADHAPHSRRPRGDRAGLSGQGSRGPPPDGGRAGDEARIGADGGKSGRRCAPGSGGTRIGPALPPLVEAPSLVRRAGPTAAVGPNAG